MAKELPELEKARDEKVIPVARALISDLGGLLGTMTQNEPLEFTGIVATLIRTSVDREFNIATDNSYLFQVGLGVLSALNAAVQTCTTTDVDDARFAQIAAKVLAIVAAANVSMGGDVTPEQTLIEFAPIKEQLNALFLEEKLSKLETKHIMDLVLRSFESITKKFNDTVEYSSQKAEAYVLGVEVMSDVTMKNLEDILTKKQAEDQATQVAAAAPAEAKPDEPAA